MKLIYRLHAVERMFERDILESEVEGVVLNGEIIESYLDDKPYVSFLSFAYCEQRALHVVYAIDEENQAVVITVYQPDSAIWEDDMKTRRNKK